MFQRNIVFWVRANKANISASQCFGFIEFYALQWIEMLDQHIMIGYPMLLTSPIDEISSLGWSHWQTNVPRDVGKYSTSNIIINPSA